MIYTNLFVIIFLAGTLLKFVFNHVLEFVDYRFRKSHSSKPAAELASYIDSDTLSKTAAYENAKYFFYIPHSIVHTALKVILVVSGFYVFLLNRIWDWTQNEYLAVILFSVISSAPSSILDIPFDLFAEFKIEKKFGFSNMTGGMWLLDQIKGLVVEAVLSIPLLLLVMFILIHVSVHWWLLTAIVFIAFSLAISWLYPVVLAPVFNKFVPLEEGELKTKLENLLSRCGFKSSGIFKMDASKRSKHSNAYFTGLGKNKRIVLFDTLMEQLNADEIESVLGHELGHFKHKHIIKKMTVSIPMIIGVMYLLSLLCRMPLLFEGFGFPVMMNQAGEVAGLTKYSGIFLAGLVFSGYGILASIVSNFFSRRDEFQADAFSVKICGTGEPLCTGLIKLNKENLHEVEVPKIYSAVHYSHPPLLERIKAIREVEKKL